MNPSRRAILLGALGSAAALAILSKGKPKEKPATKTLGGKPAWKHVAISGRNVMGVYTTTWMVPGETSPEAVVYVDGIRLE